MNEPYNVAIYFINVELNCKTQFCIFQGFETRGTEISKRLTAWENLLDSVSHVGPLTTNPIEAKSMLSRSKRSANNQQSRLKRKIKEVSTNSSFKLSKYISNPYRKLKHLRNGYKLSCKKCLSILTFDHFLVRNEFSSVLL